MTKRQIHTFIRKYNEFNSCFGDDQFNIKVQKTMNDDLTPSDAELYVVECGSDVELRTNKESELLDYVKKEVAYLQENLSQSEGALSEQLEDKNEARAFWQGIRYLKSVCSGKHYKESK